MGISLTELTVVFLVALVLFGPEKLPELARSIGKLSGQLRKTSDSLRRDFYNTVYPPSEAIRAEIAHSVDGLRSLRSQDLTPPGSYGGGSTPNPPVASVANEPPSSEGPRSDESSGKDNLGSV